MNTETIKAGIKMKAVWDWVIGGSPLRMASSLSGLITLSSFMCIVIMHNIGHEITHYSVAQIALALTFQFALFLSAFGIFGLIAITSTTNEKTTQANQG